MFPLQLNDQIIQSLSKNELKILQYVYGHSSETCEMSIHEFSRVISYSPATVLRFCRKLGFSGFAEFKYALRTNASRQPDQESVDSASKKLPTSISMERQVMISAMFNNISGTSHLISQDLLERTFAFFDSDCPIYIFRPPESRRSHAITLRNCSSRSVVRMSTELPPRGCASIFCTQ